MEELESRRSKEGSGYHSSESVYERQRKIKCWSPGLIVSLVPLQTSAESTDGLAWGQEDEISEYRICPGVTKSP